MRGFTLIGGGFLNSWSQKSLQNLLLRKIFMAAATACAVFQIGPQPRKGKSNYSITLPCIWSQIYILWVEIKINIYWFVQMWACCVDSKKIFVLQMLHCDICFVSWCKMEIQNFAPSVTRNNTCQINARAHKSERKIFVSHHIVRIIYASTTFT